MKYLCQVWFDDTSFAGMTPEKQETLDRRAKSEDQALLASGQMVMASPLAEPDTAVTLKVRGGKLSTTDGPFIETKEYMGGFIILEARDMNAAIQIASKMAIAEIGSIEVRALMEIKDWDAR